MSSKDGGVTLETIFLVKYGNRFYHPRRGDICHEGLV